MVWICSFIFDVFGQFRFESQNEERTERLFFNRCKNKSIVPKETSDNQQGFARRFSDVERLLKMTEIIFPPLQDRNYIRLGRPLYLEIAKNNNTFLTLWIVQVARDDCFHELYLHRISFFFYKNAYLVHGRQLSAFLMAIDKNIASQWKYSTLYRIFK